MPRTGVSWTVEVAGRPVRLTHPDRLLWPQEGITKAQLVRYYLTVAPLMLAHLEGRPLVLTRYPGGITGPSFYQKSCPPGTPPWVHRAPIPHEHRTVAYVVADSAAVLAWLGNLAVLEIHPWLSRADAPDLPDLAVIDLDPDPPAGFQEARQAAFMVREALARLGLSGVPKLSGASGVHVYVPLVRAYSFRQVSRFVALVGRVLARARPDLVTDERRVRLRQGRVYVDPYQNLRGKTVAGPYSPRPRPRAPVAVPVTWEELERVRPEQFSLLNVDRWFPGRLDPLLEAMRRPQSLERVLPWLETRP